MFGFGINQAQEFFIMESDRLKDNAINLLQRTGLTLEEVLNELECTPKDFTMEDFEQIVEYADKKRGW